MDEVRIGVIVVEEGGKPKGFCFHDSGTLFVLPADYAGSTEPVTTKQIYND